MLASPCTPQEVFRTVAFELSCCHATDWLRLHGAPHTQPCWSSLYDYHSMSCIHGSVPS